MADVAIGLSSGDSFRRSALRSRVIRHRDRSHGMLWWATLGTTSLLAAVPGVSLEMHAYIFRHRSICRCVCLPFVLVVVAKSHRRKCVCALVCGAALIRRCSRNSGHSSISRQQWMICWGGVEESLAPHGVSESKLTYVLYFVT